jgi:hypothetical protein
VRKLLRDMPDDLNDEISRRAVASDWQRPLFAYSRYLVEVIKRFPLITIYRNVTGTRQFPPAQAYCAPA